MWLKLATAANLLGYGQGGWVMLGDWIFVLSFLLYFVVIPLVAYLVIRLAIRHELVALKRREQRERGSGSED
jgi:hypothetical protein